MLLVFTVVFVVVLTILMAVSAQRNPMVEPTQTAVPSQNPPTIINPVVTRTHTCLPTTTGGELMHLVQCEQQAECAACTEHVQGYPLDCVTVTGGNSMTSGNQTLTHPVTVDVALPDSEAECSGHGHVVGGVCKCNGNTNPATGECVDSVCYKGDKCNIGFFSVQTAGQYCLPAYLNKCNPSTTDTVLTNEGDATSWACECKPKYAGIFTQAVEGGSCDTQLACGGYGPQVGSDGEPIKYKVGTYTDEASEPHFEEKPVVVNRLTSQDPTHTEPCTAFLRTQPIVTTGEMLPYNEYVVSPESDPTCDVPQWNNKCTVLSSDGSYIQQVARGSGLPGDPFQQRVSPAYFSPVPPGMQPCPDDFDGQGTPSHPCVNPKNKTQTAQFFTDHGEWNGQVTNLAELRASKVPWDTKNVAWQDKDAPPWRSINRDPLIDELNCLESSSYSTKADYDSTAKDFNHTSQCAGKSCTGGKGTRRAEWDGTRDGPLLDQDWMPYWVTGGRYGGQCTCDGVNPKDTVAGLVSAIDIKDANSRENWWKCIPNSCTTASFPLASYDKDSGKCDCTSATATVSNTPPFKSGMSYKTPTEPPVCVDDPCNPGGMHVRPDLMCSTNRDCEGLCLNKNESTGLGTCFIKWDSNSVKCTNDLDCVGILEGQDAVVKCHKPDPDKSGTCAVQDLQRARVGHSCTYDTECNYGACEADGKCAGGCACSPGNAQDDDYGASPLGYFCASRCNPSPCVNGGTCYLGPDGEAKCHCPDCTSGEFCETNGGLPLGATCYWHESCCSNCCHKKKCQKTDIC